MSVINTNITSMIGQQNLGKSQSSLQTSMERLSSGLRINSAKDDAAGQAIANRMTAQVSGLAQAQRNANDGISVAQTAEGGLNQINDNLQRVRELTVQASNGTNSDADLQSIQDEITQRLNEINRISEETDFNGTRVLSEDTESLQIQVGSEDGQTITVNLSTTNSSTLGLSQLDVTNMVSSDNLSESITNVSEAVEPEWTDFNVSTSGGEPFELAVGDDNALYVRQDDGTGTNVYYDATFDADTNTVTVGAVNGTIDDTGVNEDATAFDTTDGVVSLSQVGDDDIVEPDIELANVYMTNPTAGGATQYYVEDTDGNFYDATLDETTGELAVDLSSIEADAATLVTNGALTEEGTAVSAETVLESIGSAAVAADLDAVNDELGGTNTLHTNGDDSSEYLIKNEDADGKVTFYAANVDPAGEVTLQTNADSEPVEVVVDPLTSIDSALAQVDSFRSDLGAVQNRFDSAIENLSTNETNLSAARSRIEDADYAVEVANMTRAQILQQAGTSVLAQANQIPQSVLSLLG